MKALFVELGLGWQSPRNKVPGIRAATCHDTYSAERERKSDNAKILTMGARVIGPELTKTVVEAWLRSKFQGGTSIAKVECISMYERKYFRNE